MVFEIDNKLIASAILEEAFHCDLKKCHGACCVAGDAGAPLEEHETKILEDIYPIIKDGLRPEGIKAIEEQGTWIPDKDDDYATPLVEGSECAYVIFDGPTALCGIEKAYREGKIDFPKPVSCHLYPIRIKKYRSGYSAINYDQWDICAPACELGKSMKLPVYTFAKDALIRKYGKDFYSQLEDLAKLWKPS
ncbi:MAG: DUF3109 family protein [Flavobacteriales bacterium]|nr:MAG: DUF3109 family protein [Flavobacteriales bacterium]